LLPLGTCFPLPDTRGPTDALGSIGVGVNWASLAEGPHPHSMWGSSRWSKDPRPQALLVEAKGLWTMGREHAGFRFRFGRQDEAASVLLGNLAEELKGYSRKTGGFRFHFGRQ
ncbi:PREDICTED: orexigenic neuropeptide QRFP, partial [Propithecus coquereli]|uniref:orexigenic neuropeptide QRFP n=1 Tax=Propithecus coquereli TaxID=379532 RepID=UPI00063F3B6D